jgi:protein-tyrosine phosphatase
VLLPDVSNARDLGGVPLASGRVACGQLFRGPPLRLSAAGCEQAAELGIRTVIDLRTESERLGTPDSACVSADFVPAPLPIPYGLGPADYLLDLGTDESVAEVFHTFGDPSAYPVYFHCTYGRDRTGVIGALLLLTLGASRQTVMNEYLLSGPNVGAYPNALEAVLNEIERRGGPEQLLTEVGISAEEIAVLRARAVSE